MKDCKGFSLVELVTTIAILSVLSLISLPPLTAWRSNVELQGTARLFAADLQKMRVQAIKLNCPVVMLLSDSGYQVFIDDGLGGAVSGDWQRTGSEQVICHRSFNRKVLVNHTFTANRLRFLGSGGNKTGSLFLTGRNGKELEVVLSVLGRIRISAK